MSEAGWLGNYRARTESACPVERGSQGPGPDDKTKQINDPKCYQTKHHLQVAFSSLDYQFATSE